ncbi:hypothetical protein [Lysinibacillus cavernae]|nr:hypothetical protein [Lysinibacillus cavernae]
MKGIRLNVTSLSVGDSTAKDFYVYEWFKKKSSTLAKDVTVNAVN